MERTCEGVIVLYLHYKLPNESFLVLYFKGVKMYAQNFEQLNIYFQGYKVKSFGNFKLKWKVDWGEGGLGLVG